MSELVKKSTEDIKDKLYNCLQSIFEEIEAVKNHLSCIYEGVANDLDTLKTNNEHYSETDELDGYGYSCTNKTCIERIRNKVIDEFAERLKSDEFQKYNLDMVFETSRDLSYSHCINAFHEYINEITQQMKEGGKNERNTIQSKEN